MVIAAIVVASFVIAAYFYPQMPERMASHWNARGEVDGYMSRFWGLFLMPLLSLGLALLLVMIPRLDPLKANVAQFRKYFDRFVVLILLFMLYIYLLTILWNLGTRFNMVQLMAPAFAVLLYYSGVLIEKAKRNWFIGIRTPWTLSSDAVWDKTHRLGARLFKISGVLALLGAVFPDYAIVFVLVPVLVAALVTVVYSYVEYRREARGVSKRLPNQGQR